MNQFNLFFYIKLYLLTLVAFFAIDMVWLGLVARGFYRKHLGFLLAPNPNWACQIHPSLSWVTYLPGGTANTRPS